MKIGELSLREKIGQKFIFGVYSENVDVIVDLIKECYIGGVILYKNNYKNYDEMLSVIKKFKDANKNNRIPLFIAIDQEGGRVNRMPSEFSNLKNIYDVSKMDDSLIDKYADITGKMLKESGINMNFAPVMDMYDGKSKVLYKRCFYGDIDDIYRFGKRYVNSMNNRGVIPVLKHYPGHGATTVDSHFFTPYVYDYKKVLEKHILPFDRIINDKDGTVVDALMVNHMVIRKLTVGIPASISSSFIDEYIRNRNNFDGLVITDEMNMLSRNIVYKFSYLKKMFLSDSDLILVKIKSKKEAIRLIDKYVKYVDDCDNKDVIRMIDNSVLRIVRIKDKYNINDGTEYEGSNIIEINKEIDKINKLCNIK